jgi:hypothetical protein
MQVAFGSSSLTTFISGSLTLTIQLSLAPHPGATPEITPDPLRDMTYPVRWLHCRSARHPTVTGDAPLLGYGGLNPRFCQSKKYDSRTITYAAFAADPEGSVSICCVSALYEARVQRLQLTYATRVARLGSFRSTIELHPQAEELYAIRAGLQIRGIDSGPAGNS